VTSRRDLLMSAAVAAPLAPLAFLRPLPPVDPERARLAGLLATAVLDPERIATLTTVLGVYQAPPPVEPVEATAPVRRPAVDRTASAYLTLVEGDRIARAELEFVRRDNGSWFVSYNSDGEGSCDRGLYLRPGDSADDAIGNLLDRVADADAAKRERDAAPDLAHVAD